ncbi:MFS transporter [Candidatus Bathyarchaeota archaeon]|nr:MFS transporter [Candidatus Bathyarchaeota archaeon]
MQNDSQESLPVRKTFLIGFGFLSAMLCWMVYNFQMPIILAGKIAEDGYSFIRVGLLGTAASRQFWTGFIMTIDNIVAIGLQPWFGKLSDRLESRFGRRTPFMMIGVPVAAACLCLMAFLEQLNPIMLAFTSFIIVVCIFNLAMAFYRAPIVALMADNVVPKHRSTANAIINLMGGVGTAIGFLVPIFVTSIPSVKEATTITGVLATQNFFIEDATIFMLTALLMIVALVLFMTLVHEVPTGNGFWHLAPVPIEFDVEKQQVITMPSDSGKNMDAQKSRESRSLLGDLAGVFKEEEKSGAFMLLAIFSWFFGFNALEANFSRWTQEYLLLSGGFVGQLFLALPIALFLVGIPSAKIAGKIGRKKTIRLGLAFMIGSLALMIVSQEILRNQVLSGDASPNIWLLASTIAFMGVGWALININSITIIWQLAPIDKIGSYTGLYYLFSQLAAILSPTFMGGILTAGEVIAGPVHTWRSLVPFMLISMVIALLFMFKVKRGEADEFSTELEKKARREAIERLK